MLLEVLFLTPCIVIDHVESLGQHCPCSRPRLEGNCYYYL